MLLLNIPSNEVEHFSELTSADQEDYVKLNNSFKRKEFNKNFNANLTKIHEYIEKDEVSRNVRMLVCGIAWFSHCIAIHTERLAKLLNVHKTTMTRAFNCHGYRYERNKVDDSELETLLSMTPNGNNEKRHWRFRVLTDPTSQENISAEEQGDPQLIQTFNLNNGSVTTFNNFWNSGNHTGNLVLNNWNLQNIEPYNNVNMWPQNNTPYEPNNASEEDASVLINTVYADLEALSNNVNMWSQNNAPYEPNNASEEDAPVLINTFHIDFEALSNNINIWPQNNAPYEPNNASEEDAPVLINTSHIDFETLSNNVNMWSQNNAPYAPNNASEEDAPVLINTFHIDFETLSNSIESSNQSNTLA